MGPLPTADLCPVLTVGPLLVVDLVESGLNERQHAHANPAAMDGLGRPMDGLSGFVHGFPFFVFYLVYKVGICTASIVHVLTTTFGLRRLRLG